MTCLWLFSLLHVCALSPFPHDRAALALGVNMGPSGLAPWGCRCCGLLPTPLLSGGLAPPSMDTQGAPATGLSPSCPDLPGSWQQTDLELKPDPCCLHVL